LVHFFGNFLDSRPGGKILNTFLTQLFLFPSFSPDLSDLIIEVLPAVPGLSQVTRLSLQLTADMDLEALITMTDLRWLTLIGRAPIRAQVLAHIEQLPALLVMGRGDDSEGFKNINFFSLPKQCLQLFNCRSVVDDNYSSDEFCKAVVREVCGKPTSNLTYRHQGPLQFSWEKTTPNFDFTVCSFYKDRNGECGDSFYCRIESCFPSPSPRSSSHFPKLV